MVYDNKIKRLDCEEEHIHEEQDTLIPDEALRFLDEYLPQEICASSPNTDVLVLLLDLVSRGRHRNPNSLKFVTGKGVNYREIISSESKRLQCTSTKVWSDCITSTEPTGEGSLLALQRRRGWNLNMIVDNDHPAIECFRDLSEGLIQDQLANEELSIKLQT